MDLEKLLEFTRMLNTFRRVERVVRAGGEERWENDVEHSYQLALLAWYLNDSKSLGLDTNLLLKYALVHDLVEVYAGDTYIYSTDIEHLNSKHAREAEAAAKLKETFAEFPAMHEYIEQYEARQDRESKFIYALDKVEPVLAIYTDSGRTWKETGITLQMLIDKKMPQVAISPEVEPYFHDLVALLSQEEKSLFQAP